MMNVWGNRTRRLALALGGLIVFHGWTAVCAKETELTGELTVRVADYFDTGKAVTSYFVEDSTTGEFVEIHFKADPIIPLRSGQFVKVRGTKSGADFVVADDATAFTLQPSAADVQPAITGQRRVVVLLVNFSDETLSCSTSDVASVMFTGAQSVNGLYQEISFGLLSLNPDTNADGRPDVFGPFTINYSSGTCNADAWANAADAAATSAGVNLSLYQHRMYVLPSSGTCGWAGLGSIGCSSFCRTWIALCTYKDAYAHELGHNLGMQHASTDTNNDNTIDCEYCDTSDIMGYATSAWRQINAPHKEQMGWLASSDVINVTSSGTYSVAPLETDPSSTSLPLALKINRPGGGSYYLSYRIRSGYDVSLSTSYSDRCNIHRYPGSSSRTYFIKTLTDGATFQDSANGLLVRQLSHNSTSLALQISFPNTVTTNAGFILDGTVDSTYYVQSTAGTMLYAAVRGQTLYVATQSPGTNGANDHFIFVTDQLLPTATASAPWAKAGMIAMAVTKPLLGGESQNSVAGWSNAPPSSQAFKSPVNSGQMEGTLDLAAAFGAVPSNIYICAAAYATATGGALVSQAPAGNGNGNIESNEFLAIPIVTLLDRNADGLYDRLDPGLDFIVTRVEHALGGGCTITWNAQPGKTYQLEYSDALGASWQNLGAPLTAASGQLTLNQTDSTAPTDKRRFYHVKVTAP